MLGNVSLVQYNLRHIIYVLTEINSFKMRRILEIFLTLVNRQLSSPIYISIIHEE